MQCTLISLTILVTDRPIVVFPIGYMYRIERRLDLLKVLYETKVYLKKKIIYIERVLAKGKIN